MALAQRKRVRRTPRNRALGIQAFEIADERQPKIASGRRSRPTLVRVESLAQAFDVPVEVVSVEDLIQSRVKRMGNPWPSATV